MIPQLPQFSQIGNREQIWRGKGSYNGQLRVMLNGFIGKIPILYNACIVSINNSDIRDIPHMPMVYNLSVRHCRNISEITLSLMPELLDLMVDQCDNLLKINGYRLNKLCISSCYKLDEINVFSIHRLSVENSPATRICGYIVYLSLTNCSTVSLIQITLTRSIHIVNCPIKILCTVPILRPVLLQNLIIVDCNELISIPLFPLERLRIENCLNIETLPEPKHGLKSLIIINCPKLKSSNV